MEDLRGLLEMMEADEREGLRCQVPDSTAETLIEWLQSQMVGHYPHHYKVILVSNNWCAVTLFDFS